MEERPFSLLYVDDDLDQRQLLIAVMRSQQELIIYEADSAEDGLDKFMKVKPDIVITDMVMLTHNGLWLAEQIRKINKNVIIVLMSAYHDNEGIYDVPGLIAMPKPVDGSLLRSVIINCMEMVRLRRELASMVKLLIKGGV